ncbi:MAG: regulatory protein GemA [Methylicorpusculum sp.]|uniref:gp16 family protein n=1 Tax=Methylicorpusculum sp. TaxID=2713644 RepID=UPI00271625EC|nr:regulatory protein GemA [Methylicorpusculum sp.]MDO8940872.1 regulatory protein GemA [Methylicorpusculum sp.]MDP2202436.1 regulatory protein GemA [Methylicorpusculum sp.]
MTNSTRQAELAKIHIAKKQLDLDDDTYRQILKEQGGAESSSKLTALGRAKVLDYFRQKGFSAKAKPQHGRAPNNLGSQSDRAAKLGKIQALLAEANRPFEYAQALAKRMYKKDALEFCSHAELTGIITALVKNAKKEGRRVE